MKKKFLILLSAAAALTMGMLAVGCSDGGNEEPPAPVYGPGEVDPNVKSISLNTKNAKTVFDIGGEAFDYSGVELILHYDGDVQKPALIVKDMVTVPDTSTRGQKNVTVTYGNFASSYDITVRELESLVIDSSNATTRFELNSDFNTDGLVVSAKYYDIDEAEVIPASMYDARYDLSTRGDKHVTVNYLTKSERYPIRVVSAPTEITTAVVTSDSGTASFTVSGKVKPEAEYAGGEIGLDLQKHMTDDHTGLTVTLSNVTDDGEFVVKGTLPSDLDTASAYMTHLFLGGDSYDIASIAQPADNTVKAGSTYYRVKSEKLFSDNESLFVAIRSSNALYKIASYTVDKFEIIDVDGAAHAVISGKHGNYTQEQIAELAFHFDAETNPKAYDGSSTPGTLAISVNDLELQTDGDSYTVSVDISSLGKYNYTLHFCPSAASGDARNISCDGKNKSVVIGKVYNTIFDNPSNLYWGSVGLEVTHSFKMSSATLIEDGGKAYVKITGACAGIDSLNGTELYLEDLTHNAFSKEQIALTVRLPEESGEFTLTAELPNGSTLFTVGDPLVLWIKCPYLKNGDGFEIYNLGSEKYLPGGVEDAIVTSGGYTYSIAEVENPFFSDGKIMVGITLVSKP